MPSDPEHGDDLLISYAHVDDRPAPGAERGWVSSLVQDLDNLLAQKMGRPDAFSIWWDQTRLQGNQSITPEIRARVQQSRTLVIVLSPGYLASEWCLREMDIFFEALGGSPDERVFVVEMQALGADHAVPDELVDLKGYRFLYKDESQRTRTLSIQSPEPHQTEYIRLVEDLAVDISQRLKALRAATPPASAEPKATVYLAEVTEDLEPQREQMRRYLEQAQLRVLPERRFLEGEEFQQALMHDLTQSKLFVQLLGQHPSRRPPTIPQGYTRLQLEQAQASSLPILQWRDTTLVLDQVASADQQQLLDAVTVFAEPLEVFKQRVVQQATAPPPPPPSPPGPAPVVFINTERRDRTLAESLRDHVDARLLVTLPIGAGKAGEIRADLNRKLADCDALIVVYGDKTLAWVEKQLMHCNRIAAKRRAPLRALGVYDGPPEDKPEVSTRMPGLVILDCRKGLDKPRLEAFLAPLLASLTP